MEGQSRKFQAAQIKAEQAAQEVQRQISSSYKQGYLDGSIDERRLMTDDLRNMLNTFSQNCENRAKTQETHLGTIQDLGNQDVVENGEEQEPGAVTRIAARFAPNKDSKVANIQDAASKSNDIDNKITRKRKT